MAATALTHAQHCTIAGQPANTSQLTLFACRRSKSSRTEYAASCKVCRNQYKHRAAVHETKECVLCKEVKQISAFWGRGSQCKECLQAKPVCNGKECKGCKEYKTKEHFGVELRGIGGLRARCNTCRSARDAVDRNKKAKLA